MTVTTLRPNGTMSSAGVTVTGAASAHAALSDNSDSSYITGLISTSFIYLDLENWTPSAGAVYKTWSLRVRVARTDAEAAAFEYGFGPNDPYGVYLVIAGPSVTWTTPTTVVVYTDDPPMPSLAPQNRLQGIGQIVIGGNGTRSATVRLYALYIDVIEVAKPVTAPLNPSGSITRTNKPLASWENTLDPDGGAQTAYEVKYFTSGQYSAGGFSPATSTATVASGIQSGSASFWAPSTTMADGTYRAYVRVAQTVNGSYHWSDWAYSGYTQSVALPADPTIAVSQDPGDACTHITVTSNTGTASTDAFELQRSTDGGVTWEPVRLLDT